jgi:hypothetical protein
MDGAVLKKNSEGMAISVWQEPSEALHSSIVEQQNKT